MKIIPFVKSHGCYFGPQEDKPIDLTNAYMWESINWDRIIEIPKNTEKTYKTEHTYAYYGFFKPCLDEILRDDNVKKDLEKFSGSSTIKEIYVTTKFLYHDDVNELHIGETTILFPN